MLFEKRVKLRLNDFDYKLPKSRIAQEPWPRSCLLYTSPSPRD